MNLLPSQPYVATGATTLTKATGAMSVSDALLDRPAGAAVGVADGTVITSDRPLAVTVSAGALAGSCGQFSLKSGATVNDRRILSVATTTTPPTTATDGFALSGAGLVIIDVATAGAITWQLYTYSATSGLWQLDTSLGIAGSVAMGGSGQSRTEVDLRGLDRMAIVVSVNGAGSAVQAWATGVPVIYS